MSNKLCVYTCITGDYDSLKEIEFPEKDIDYYCFTNNKNLKSKTWKIIQINDSKLDNRLLARKTKILGHPTINDNYDIAIWTDADVVWQRPISEFVKTYFKDTNFAIFKHHSRNNIHDEAITCLVIRKDNKENIVKILDFYKSVGYPDDNGLCESTVFIKNTKNPQVIKTAEIWYDTVKNYSPRDQLSFNYAIWKTKLPVFYIDLNVWGNSWFSTTPHNSTPKIDSCHVYYGDSNQGFDIDKYYVYDYHKKGQTYYFKTILPRTTKEIEFNPANIIGIKYQDVVISPRPKNIATNGIVLSVSCNPRITFCAYGSFEKGKELSFSFSVNTPTQTEFNEILNAQWKQNNQIAQNLLFENSKLSTENTRLQEDLQRIINSKGWRMLEKMRKLLPHSSKTN